MNKGLIATETATGKTKNGVIGITIRKRHHQAWPL